MAITITITIELGRNTIDIPETVLVPLNSHLIFNFSGAQEFLSSRNLIRPRIELYFGGQPPQGLKEIYTRNIVIDFGQKQARLDPRTEILGSGTVSSTGTYKYGVRVINGAKVEYDVDPIIIVYSEKNITWPSR